MRMVEMAVLVLALSALWAASAGAAEVRRFEGYRALVLAPDTVWQEWDSAIYGALEERGFAVTYRREVGAALLAESFDLVALNAERRLSETEQDALIRYVADGGALYVSYDQPYAWGRGAAPGGARLLREAGHVSAARSVGVSEVVIPPGAVSGDMPLTRCTLKVHAGPFKAPAVGWTAVALEPMPGTVVLARDAGGAALGTLSEHGKGRMVVMGLPLEQEKYLEDAALGPRLLDSLLQWLLAGRPEPRPLDFITLAVPARAEVTGVFMDGQRVSDAAVRQVGSLKTVRLDTSAWPREQAREIRITYRPLSPGRNIQTILHMPWGVLRGAADSPSDLAGYLSSLGVTICQPLLRSANGRAWYRGMPEDSPDDKVVTGYKGDFLADVIRECHARHIKVVAGIYLDNNQPLRRYGDEARRIDRQGQPVRDQYNQPAACFNNPRGQEHNLATIEHLLSHYGVDGLVLDDNYWLDYSDMYACYCAYCKDSFRRWCDARGVAYADPATAQGGEIADLWWEHKRQATRALADRVRQIARAHGVTAGGWVSNGMGMTHLAGPFDFLYQMAYTSAPRAMRGPLSLMGERPMACVLWEPDVSGEQLERELREAVHAGCQIVGIWTGVIAERYQVPPEKLAAIKRAFGSVEQEWRRYYEQNVLTGDPRFILIRGSAQPEQLQLTIVNGGRPRVGGSRGNLDLSGLP